MTGSDEQARYGPIQPELAGIEPAHRRPFDIADMSVTGLVIVCELADPPAGNSRPTMSMKITQYLRLSDESMVRLDMDRGVDSFYHGSPGNVSWQRSAADVVSEAITLVQADSPEPNTFPWDEYSQAALLRGILVRPEHLRNLPYSVLLSNELAAIHEF
jgi:hypothetical protein